MYNLLVVGADQYWETERIEFPIDRFLEHTEKALKLRFLPASDLVLSTLMKFPVLAAYELGVNSPARVAHIRDARIRNKEIEFRLEFLADVEPITSEFVETHAVDLGFDSGFELRRTHWALKDVDLDAVLLRNNFLKAARIDSAPMPSYSRKLVLAAATMLQHLGHPDLDQFLLELDLSYVASREVGSRQERAIAIGAYAVSNFEGITATGNPLGYDLIARAAELDQTYPAGQLSDVTDRKRLEFWSEAEARGWLRDGVLVSADFRPEPPSARVAPRSAIKSPGTARLLASRRNDPMDSLFGDVNIKPSVTALEVAMPEVGSRIFIVHGRDDHMKEAVARYVEQLGLEAIILHEQINKGRTILQKFKDEAAKANFAIILLSPDDVGGLDSAHLNSRARQNVILEMGFFLGTMPENSVVALVKDHLETPSDFDGVVYVPFDNAGAWKTRLAREIREAGVGFDANKALR
jgi:predicted nucleotide-binding protein